MKIKKFIQEITSNIVSNIFIQILTALPLSALAFFKDMRFLYAISLTIIVLMFIMYFIQRKKAKPFYIQPSNSLASETYWHMGSQDEQPIMTVFGNFIVTNRSDEPLILTRATLKKLKSKGWITVKEINSKYNSTNYKIPPKETTKCSVTFIIDKPVKNEGEAFIDNVIFFNQFNEKFCLKKVKFDYE